MVSKWDTRSEHVQEKNLSDSYTPLRGFSVERNSDRNPKTGWHLFSLNQGSGDGKMRTECDSCVPSSPETGPRTGPDAGDMMGH
jgi:hypothetical protein